MQDKFGQPLAVGDWVAFGVTVKYGSSLRTGQITEVKPRSRYWNSTPENYATITYQSPYGGRRSVVRSVSSANSGLVKLNGLPQSVTAGPKAIALAKRIAPITHEVNRAYCISIGDGTQKPWAEAPEWQKKSAEAGVLGILLGTIKTPEQSHQSWLDEKTKTGWKFGYAKDEVAKTHPCMVPYADLPPAQKVKDSLFFATVKAAEGSV